MIAFIDFVPQKIRKNFLISHYENFSRSAEKMNEWLQRNSNYEIINIETVVLPNIHNEEGSEDTNLHTSGEMSSDWYQFIRVWYRR